MSTSQSAAVAAVTPLTQSAGLATNETIPTASTQSADILDQTAAYESTTAAGGPVMSVTVEDGLTADASVEDAAGQAVIIGAYVGTPAWALEDDASGKYAIDEDTGAITVADTLTATTDEIEIAVTGITPAVTNITAEIVVAAGEG
jgi:hypothetical protein